MDNSLQQVIEKLEALFSTFNTWFFGGQLEKPVITVSPDTTKGAYGWCTGWKAWKVEGQEEGHYEINICAEYLARPFLQICETMIHEMVHLQNLKDGVKDTSRSGKYHNKRYKETAEQHGLEVSKDDKYGWCVTKLTEEATAWIISTFTVESKFSLYRAKATKTSKTSKSARKYVCPMCGAIIRATKEVRVMCVDCDAEFEEEM